MRRHAHHPIRHGIAACAALLLAIPTVTAQVIDPGLETILSDLGPQERVSVIVRFGEKVDLNEFHEQDKGLLRAQIVTALKDQSNASQRAIEHLVDNPSVSRRAALWGVNGLAITASAQVITALAHNPNVASVSMDAVIEGPVTEAGGSATPEWNLDAIRAPQMWAAGHTGSGVVVAGLDTGVDASHPDLAPSFRGGSNSWYDPNGEHATPYDASGHGTQSMGLMIGGSAGGSAIGVAPDATWIAAKIFNDAGSSPLSAIHQAFQWALDPDGNPSTNDSADIVNNSWSLRNIGGCDLEFEQDIRVLKAAQIAVVFAGGNYGPYASTSVSPANNPSGFATGAVDDLSQVAPFSSSGPSACDGSSYPEVVAPGVSVRTTDLTLGGTYPSSYASVNGTSFSAPHVSGAMALLLSAYPSATVSEIEQALKDTAVDLGASGPDNAYGHGQIDAMAAASWLADPPYPVCTDLDGDGFFGEAICGIQFDCNDLDAAINPTACDIKSDGIDQDCDGSDRTGGKPCPSSGGGDTGGGGGDTGGNEGNGPTCSDGIDNDGDWLVDCADPGCARNKSCK